MHFEFTVTLGDLLKVASILGIGWPVLLHLRKLDILYWQHNILWNEFVSTHEQFRNLFKAAGRNS